MSIARTSIGSVRIVSNQRPQPVAAKTMDTAYQQISRGTASPVLVTDERWRIVAINPEAEKLLGRSSQDVQGQPCHGVLCGRDRYGNHFCHENCVIGTMAQRGEAVRPFEIDVTSADGEKVRAACSVIVLRDGPESRIVHILTPIPSGTERGPARPVGVAAGATAAGCAAEGAHRYALTPRELEVLRLLAHGSDCHGISKTLFISLPTVRNHVHNCLRKLNVHSQVEAVALAYRETLI
jgi:PAS domain S-box-containing protein